MEVEFDLKARGGYGPEPGRPLWQLALCKIGIHVYGDYTITRFNPHLNMSAYHSRCACGLNKAKLVWHKGEEAIPTIWQPDPRP